MPREFDALKTKTEINVAVHVTVGLPRGELGLGCETKYKM
jgi:hypothetical protein